MTYNPLVISSAAEFSGQPAARALLERYIERGRLAGTFLLLGQRGLGKSTLATIIARALCCTGDKPGSALSFCGSCYACRSIAAGEQPEFVTVRPLGQNISVKQLDEEHGGLATALYHPNLLSHRVFIIDNAHYLNEESGNRLLKLFEEAPARTVFLLTTDRPELLLPTIHSRGQKITLLPLPAAGLATQLSARGIDQAAADEAALLSGGRFVDGLALAGNAAWRASLRSLGEAIMRRSSLLEVAADAAGFEHAMLWEKEQADHGMEEAELEKVLPKARRNELARQALISAYDRASWWLLNEGSGEQGTGNREQRRDVQGARGNDPGGKPHPTSHIPPHSSAHPSGSRTSRVGGAAGDARAGMSNGPAAPDGVINMDDWESGARASGFGDPQRPQSDSRQRSAETRNRTPDTRLAETRNPKPETRNRIPGPCDDPQYMAKLALLRRRISGNVDRELAQMAFEASL